MTLWLILALMTVLAIAAVIWPLLRHGVAVRSGSDIAVYRDQLDEIARDRATGLIGKTEAEAARVEISRRLIAASEAAKRAPQSDSAPQWRRWAVAAFTLMLVPLGATGLYLRLGQPGLASEPLVARMEAPANNREQSVEKLIVQVEQHLQSNPKDGRGWEVLAPVYMQVGRFTDSVNAWRNAINLLGDSADREADLGEALTAAANGVVTAEAKAAFVRSVTLDNTTVTARFISASPRSRTAIATRPPRSGRASSPMPNPGPSGSAPCAPRLPVSRASRRRRTACPGRPRPKCWPRPNNRRRSTRPRSTAWLSGWPSG